MSSDNENSVDPTVQTIVDSAGSPAYCLLCLQFLTAFYRRAHEVRARTGSLR